MQQVNGFFLLARFLNSNCSVKSQVLILLAMLGFRLAQFLFFFFINHSLQQSPDSFPNPRLYDAFVALQAWKQSISEDPKNFTGNWNGPDVCSYNGVFCAPALDNHTVVTVAGIDLNHANIAGTLPEELGKLTDLALFHLNSNRFQGCLPNSFSDLNLLFELDISNNLFSGEFPTVVLHLFSLKYLDIRFNHFTGNVPCEVFDLQLDALFINNNDFCFSIPSNIGNSPVSVLVAANNNLRGCLPPEIGLMANTLNQIVLLNNELSGCLPIEIGFLNKLTVFDIGFNRFAGCLPASIGGMIALEQLNLGHNLFSGKIPPEICSLPRLENFTYSYNYFTWSCTTPRNSNGDRNCIPFGQKNQRTFEECAHFYLHPANCLSFR